MVEDDPLLGAGACGAVVLGNGTPHVQPPHTDSFECWSPVILNGNENRSDLCNVTKLKSFL